MRAKTFKEKMESRICKTWREGEVRINMTRLVDNELIQQRTLLFTCEGRIGKQLWRTTVQVPLENRMYDGMLAEALRAFHSASLQSALGDGGGPAFQERQTGG